MTRRVVDPAKRTARAEALASRCVAQLDGRGGVSAVLVPSQSQEGRWHAVATRGRPVERWWAWRCGCNFARQRGPGFDGRTACTHLVAARLFVERSIRVAT